MDKRLYRLDQPTRIAPRSKLERVAYRRLLTLSSAASFTVDAVAPVITASPAIAQRLLNYVNSTSRTPRRRVTTIRHAIALLGANGLRDFSEPIVKSMNAKKEPSRIRLRNAGETASDSLAN